MDRITEIKQRLEKNRKDKEYILENVIKAAAPSGYKESTSYLDADCIRGSRKEVDLAKVYEALGQLDNLIYLDELILDKMIKEEVEIPKRLEELPGNKERVYYLRQVQGYTQERTAEILGISDRHVRRIEGRLHNK